MNANKQDAGWLPELPEPVGHVHSDYEYCAERPFKNDGWPVSVYEAHQVRAYGELCRAAPAGGDEKLARFGHHPDPVIDFEIEVESLQSRLFDAKHRIAKVGTQPETVEVVSTAIARAMEFRVGGDESAVRAKAMLRALQSDSAPAGSGEVEAFARKIEQIADERTMITPGTLREIAALLRKLQQGADSK